MKKQKTEKKKKQETRFTAASGRRKSVQIVIIHTPTAPVHWGLKITLACVVRASDGKGDSSQQWNCYQPIESSHRPSVRPQRRQEHFMISHDRPIG